MRKISVVMLTGFLICGIVNAQAQYLHEQQLKVIAPYHVAISYAVTTNIIFPYAIISVDRGSRDVLAQKAKGVENILQLKAARDSFPETNLSVITADGKLTSFMVDYASQPSGLNLSLADTAPKNAVAVLAGNTNTKEMEQYAGIAAISKARLRGVKDHSYGIRFRMDGLFIHDETMYLRFRITNETNVDYDIDQLRFYIRDQKKAKRTATQEIEIQPVHVSNNTNKVTRATDQTIVFAVPKFTIPDKKYLAIQLMEKNGGRHMELHIKNRDLLKVISIN
ncbi:conjugative transposon protein TraN [Parafilimonas terrae]|uniref:Bacteroides conjugative transposon TraN protein n=1 Tax=Parafilimonas terrae TaxID=1465490 RepID=A0A1I5XEB9_9BACT|nr:conjugative transposon protein TraN [Parafilimonas terrae]SFQ30319.1 Bacteroides conjugative transposon TraN protein [Parafilimonas terrae]